MHNLSNLPPGVTDAMIDDHFDPAVCPDCEAESVRDSVHATMKDYDVDREKYRRELDWLVDLVRDSIAENVWRVRVCETHAAKEHDE